jgi:hypothetical protein
MLAVRGALATLGVLALCAAISAPAGAAERREATLDTGAKDRPVAWAACPPCVVAGAAAVARAAVAVRAATATRGIVAAGGVARAMAPRLTEKLTRAKVRRTQRQARRVSRRPDKWIQDNWSSFKPHLKACLATTVFMEAHGYMRDRILRKKEWSEYVIFGPRLVPATETLSINFPVRFDGEDLVHASDEALECAVGLGWQRWFRAD